MITQSKDGLNNTKIIIIVVMTFLFILVMTYGAQYLIEHKAVSSSKALTDRKTEFEIGKLDAEIKSIRSDTAGSLFWLKLIALFVTVGGAVGGYLIGQSRATQAKINFEDRKNVDEVYQSIIRELADSSPILRAGAVVKLGSILKSFPVEWNVSNERKEQLFQLTKQVLAAALSIEIDKKVLKTLTINLILHKPQTDELAIVKEMDLSGAKAEDAYWARCNFEYSDFYAADLSKASFRKSNLTGAQFREANLTNSVLDEAICTSTNFKMADLRGASLRKARLNSVNFDNAKIYAASLTDTYVENIPECQVDISAKGDGSHLISVSAWLDSMNKGEKKASHLDMVIVETEERCPNQA